MDAMGIRVRARSWSALGFLAVALAARAGGAQPAADPAPPDARAEFVRGTQLVEAARWAEALAAFERAASLRSHAVTTFNIGACERAMGRYARARRTFERALAENDASGSVQLSESLVGETRGYVAEIDGLVAHVTVTLVPWSASIAVDGRPLQATSGERDVPVAIAGVRPPGPGEAAPSKRFVVVMDPGAHVFVVSRKGFTDAVVQKTVSPGARLALDLQLDRLPATLRIDASRPGALVTVNDRDIGPVPVDVSRPAGRYRVGVRLPGFEPYDAAVVVDAGELLQLRAPLKPEQPSITSRWWFWTAAAVVLTGTAVGTYFATRPEPTRPEVSGGTLGWKVPVGE
jgi:hypothetical protein